MVLVTLKLLASLGQICQIVWAGNYAFKDGRGNRVASWLREATHDTQMEATHSVPLSQGFFRALKSRTGPAGAQEANGKISREPGIR